MEKEKMVTDSEIERAFDNADFGDLSNRDVVDSSVLKCASGWHQGFTAETISRDLGLITKNYRLTKKGQRYLWAAFSEPKKNI